MESDDDIALHDLERIEANLSAGQRRAEADGFMIQSATGFMIQSATGFMIQSATGFMIQ